MQLSKFTILNDMVGMPNATADAFVQAVMLVGAESRTLVAGVTLSAGGASVAVTGVDGASYIFTAQFSGTSVTLQSLGPDAINYVDIVTLTESGARGVVIGDNATVRLLNGSNGEVTDLHASLT